MRKYFQEGYYFFFVALSSKFNFMRRLKLLLAIIEWHENKSSLKDKFNSSLADFWNKSVNHLKPLFKIKR